MKRVEITVDTKVARISVSELGKYFEKSLHKCEAHSHCDEIFHLLGCMLPTVSDCVGGRVEILQYLHAMFCMLLNQHQVIKQRHLVHAPGNKSNK